MLVAICDDEKFFRSQLKAFLVRYKTERRLHIDICEYSTGEALLHSGKIFDMVYLDYQMPGIDGMEVARALRRRNFTCGITFVTGYSHFMQEAFEVQPYRFLTKPILETQIIDLMNEFIRQQRQLAPLIVINDSEQKTVHVKDILYLEGDGKYCIIRTLQETYNSSKTLAQVHALLPQHYFYRSHKSYVVNLYSISTLDDRVATLINGENALIGRGKIGEFKRVYRRFLKDYYFNI